MTEPEVIVPPRAIRTGVIRQPEDVTLASGDSIEFATTIRYGNDGSAEVVAQDYRVVLLGDARETPKGIGS